MTSQQQLNQLMRVLQSSPRQTKVQALEAIKKHVKTQKKM